MDLKKFALCQHVANCDHFIAWDDAKIKRPTAEGYFIKRASEVNAINRNDGANLPSVYRLEKTLHFFSVIANWKIIVIIFSNKAIT